MAALYALYHLTALLLGLAIGSFLNVVILRVPEGRSVVRGGSGCPVCHTPIAPKDNIPVVSWLLLKGRCRHCNAPISPQYPLVEATTGLLSWLMFKRMVPSSAELDVGHMLAWGVFFTFTCLLLASAWTDIRGRIIPAGASIYAVPVGIGLHGLLQAVGYTGWLGVGWKMALLGAGVWGGLLGALSLGWLLVTGREGLAWGDVRLAAMMGSFLGVAPHMFSALFGASVIGVLLGIVAIAIARRNLAVPFAPFLAVGGIGHVLYGDILWAAWLPDLAGRLF